jgi:TolA-binding protein
MEAEINRLTKRIEELKTEYAGDEQIIPFLEQESAAMEEQKSKGFAEEAVPADEGVPSEDPNSMQGAFPIFPQN